MLVHPGVRRIRVLCVDDVADVTKVLQLLIDMEPDMECVGCLALADDMVDRARDLKADVVLLDATIPSGKSPFEVMSELSSRSPQVKTIIFSGYTGQAFMDRANAAGAWGCVSKNDPPQEVLQAVREVAAGNTYFGGIGQARSFRPISTA